MKNDTQEKVEALLLDAAEAAKALATKIRSRTNYSDGFHKQASAEIAALNTQQNSAGKILVSRMLFGKSDSLAAKALRS